MILLRSARSFSNSLQFPAIPVKFPEICGEKCSICWKIRKIFQNSGNFNEKVQNNAKISTGAVQRCDNLVDLEKCWKMRLLSLSEVSIQKRTSPDKFTGELGIRDFEISFAISHVLAIELAGQGALSTSSHGSQFMPARYTEDGTKVYDEILMK